MNREDNSTKVIKWKISSIIIVIFLASIYITTFISASIYTKPTKEMATYKITCFLSTYYTNSPDEWIPFEHYHTIIKNGYYKRDCMGRWIFHSEDLKLSGEVSIENDIGRE
jgi:hypothetical protein